MKTAGKLLALAMLGGVFLAGCGDYKPRFEMGEYSIKDESELMKLCDDKDFRACVFLADAYTAQAEGEAEANAKFYANAPKDLVEKACKGGDGMACFAIANAYKDGLVVAGVRLYKADKDKGKEYALKGAKYLEKTCEAGYLTDCYTAIEFYQNAATLKDHKKKAKKLEEVAEKIRRKD